ncbi:MAG: triose-phosphate isomerase, partial [Candidatus Omnitrophota bacterium]
GRTFEVLKDHVLGGFSNICKEDALKIIIAYEPVWAIGTGKTATSLQAQEAHKYIRGLLTKLYDPEVGAQIRIQYGGSVKPENITELLQQPDIDGALVGGASLQIAAFADIVKKAAEVIK